ncbi:Hypothetical predicted protein [Mytilus galloprovincialis]|nr:Hypothetical predicted protein [Mytilus galloprovincialis]
MLAFWLVFTIIYGVHASIDNHGCPDDPPRCYDYCNKQKGCLTGYCSVNSLFLMCQCQGCTQKKDIRYRNYGCSNVKVISPPGGNITHQLLRDIVYGKRLKPNIWPTKK